MVARGAGAAGPVLLACRQWDPCALAGWRSGHLALGLVCDAVRHYCLGGCSALVVCVRRSRPVRRAWASAGFCAFLISPFPPRVSCALCGWPSRPGVPYPRSLVRHSMRSVRSAGSVRLPFWYSPRTLCVCVRSRSRGVRAPAPLPGIVWRAHLARSRCWALVGPFNAVRAPPRVLPRSRAPFVLLRGGGRPGPVSPYLAWGCALPVGGVRAWGPVTIPTARALASWLCALCGRHEGARGGACCLGAGRPGSGALRPPTTRPFGRAARAHYPLAVGAGGCGRGDLSPTPQRALLRAGFVRSGGDTRAPGAGRFLPGCGASGVGRSPTPDRSSFRACGRGPLPTGCGCGGSGRGNMSPTPLRALLRAGSARCGGGIRVPGGGGLLPRCRASGVGRSPTLDHLSFRACGRGPLPTA